MENFEQGLKVPLHTATFDEFAQQYDQWFENHHYAYKSELEALRRFIPRRGIGIEIGVGSGRFSAPLGITIGVEPSDAMADIARSRGITICRSIAEELPFKSECLDFVLMVTTLCFVSDPLSSLKETYRVLKPTGMLILGILDRETNLGRVYKYKFRTSKFYRPAVFYSTDEVLELLKQSGFSPHGILQTIFSNPDAMNATDPVREGYGKGVFVVIRSFK